jgi:hypothetical protein
LAKKASQQHCLYRMAVLWYPPNWTLVSGFFSIQQLPGILSSPIVFATVLAKDLTRDRHEIAAVPSSPFQWI